MSDQQVTKSDGMTPGAVLADARVSLGLTQREIADVLNLTVTVLDALEPGTIGLCPALFLFAATCVPMPSCLSWTQSR